MYVTMYYTLCGCVAALPGDLEREREVEGAAASVTSLPYQPDMPEVCPANVLGQGQGEASMSSAFCRCCRSDRSQALY